MNTITFTVPGAPVPKARARVGKFGAYTPKRTKEYETKVRALALIARQKAHQQVWTGRVCVELEVHISGNKTTSKPDLDNLIKCLDGCKGVIFKDDAQVVGIAARKVAGYEDPKAVFRFFQIGE